MVGVVVAVAVGPGLMLGMGPGGGGGGWLRHGAPAEGASHGRAGCGRVRETGGRAHMGGSVVGGDRALPPDWRGEPRSRMLWENNRFRRLALF